ncbi:MAG TPA: hypothetical protein VGI71_21755 [Scandinavium sp.]|jgi:chromosome segregation ATPase
MSTVTFVVDFEDNKEPVVHSCMSILGGKLRAVAWRDVLDSSAVADGLSDPNQTSGSGTTPMTKEALAHLRRAAAAYQETLAAHQQNPRDASALEAWDNATNEFARLINNDEINIIAALLDALEAKDKRIAELKRQWEFRSPTPDAYEAACKALENHRQRADEAEKQIEELQSRAESAEQRVAEFEVKAFNPALLDVVAERRRQKSVEGWTPEHDDVYQNSELADAAACYAIHAHNQGFSTPAHWPWSPDWWKQSGARRDLVKSGALVLAEIERLDRAAGITLQKGGENVSSQKS